MKQTLTRRDALRTLAVAVGVAAIRPPAASAASDLPHLALTDPSAIALGYHEDARTVDSKVFANYQPGQLCSNCLQLKGDAADVWRPCNIYPGKLVNANGWCRTWANKP